MTDRRDLDVVVMGATGFVGRLVAGHLATAAPSHVRIGLAGRSLDRLEEVRRGLGRRAETWPLLHADAHEPDTLQALVSRTRAVATTVGPYLRSGIPLVAACAEAGTHYADLTGETLFVHEVAQRYDEPARRTGARLVNACGFDSVPSDLSVLLLHERAVADGAGELTDTTLLVERVRGGVSGGTIDSLRAQLEAVDGDPSRRRLLSDPYALDPPASPRPEVGGERDTWSVFRERDSGRWVAPFVMAPFNTRIVRRSNALLGGAYGERFRYRELVPTGTRLRGYAAARAVQLGTGALAAGMASPLTRGVLDRLLPSPGEGPSEEVRRNGGFRMRTLTTTTSGRRYEVVFAADGDPGYAATAVMLGQAVLALALDGDHLPDRAGVLTPATALGGRLVERLRDQGFRIDVRPVGSA